MTATVSFRIHPIPADTLDAFRAAGVDVSGNPIERLVADGDEPLRCCLRPARPGERLILFGYRPPLPPSPYVEVGPVFGHAERCAGPADMAAYPPEWLGRPQVLRAYDERGWIHPATRLHDGRDPVGAIAELLDNPGVVQIHSRNVAYGCYMFAVTRVAAPGGVGTVGVHGPGA